MIIISHQERILSIADEIMRILGVPSSELDSGEDQLDKALPNARFRNQKMEGWFEKHPYLGTARIALWHYNKGTYPIESMFYMLSDSPRKEKIAATTHLFPHWEDNDLTMIRNADKGCLFRAPANILLEERDLRLCTTYDEFYEEIRSFVFQA